MYKNNDKKFILTRNILLVVLLLTCIYTGFNLHQNKYTKVVKIGVIDSLLDSSYTSKYDVVYNKKITTDPIINNHGVTVLDIIKRDNKSQVYYVSTLNSSIEAPINDVAKAIYWCVENNVDIINMSFATTEDNPLLKKAVQYAIEKNTIVVASCINNYDGYSYPANYAGVISVSDTDYGKAVIKAKKQDYTVKLLDGNVIKGTGTSCATAYVTNRLARELSGKEKPTILEQIRK